MKRLWPLLFIILAVAVFFKSFLLQGKLPIPSDTIVGLYYPFRDFYSKEYPRGIPYKNFLITDPVRQQYPWKNLALSMEKTSNLPLWNPYNFSGTPLLANLQSGPFYPLNLLFFIFSTPIAWSLFILLQPVLAGIFLFLYLDNLKLDKKASLFGAVTFSFCGFSISWLEWGNILSTGLWLPLLLLATDKIIEHMYSRRKLLIWMVVYIFSLLSSFLAGHLQIFFYLFLVNVFYALFKIFKSKNYKILPAFILIYGIFVALSSFIWLPALQFINFSARNLDQVNWRDAGWFIPWQNLIQFISPDFFGNPSTLNYSGIWNYGEFIGYVGIGALIFSFLAILIKKERQVLFFAFVLLFSLLFSLPNFISSIPYRLSLPFISTSQPTRLIYLIDLSLSVLAAFGLDRFLNLKSKKQISFILVFFTVIFAAHWIFVLGNGFGIQNGAESLISKRNLVFPSIIFLITSLLIILYIFLNNKYIAKFSLIIIWAIILISAIDLFRLGWKYNAFTDPKYLYPNTDVISYLQKNTGNYRIMETDPQILPPNFSIMYKLQSVDGYDPLYIQRYGELIAALGRGKPDISPPFGFNRIIVPQNYNSEIINLLGVKYILSIKDINEPTFRKIFDEGQTKIYENSLVFDRAFFIGRTVNSSSRQQTINLMFDKNFPLKQRAIVENSNTKIFSRTWSVGKAQITHYSPNYVKIATANEKEGFLVLTDTYYPTWHAKIDNKEAQIYITDFNFRGIIVPAGKHVVEFYDKLF